MGDITYEITIFAVLAVILLVVKGIYDEKKYRRQLYNHLKNTWGQPTAPGYYPGFMEVTSYYYRQNRDAGDIDDITYNDLDMDKIYECLDHTQTSIGCEYLYALLRKPCTDISMLEERERVISLFAENEEERIKLQTALVGMGRLKKISVYQYFENIKNMEGENRWYHIFCCIALLVSLALCFVKPSLMVLVTVAIIIYNIISYYKSKAGLAPYLQIFSFVARAAAWSEDIAKVNIPGLEKYQERLISCTRSLKKFRRNSFVVSGGNMGGSVLDSLMDYIRIMFHLDLIKMCSMIDELKKHEDELMDIYNTTGFIDSMLSIASFRAGAGSWCVPALYNAGSNNQGMEFTGMYHPLLSNPVKNSIKAGRGVLITGSNASGKSVFIKTVAINAIFAQTIHTVLADSYSSCFYNIYSSMALRDDITGSESYYIVEIKSLKRILDRAAEKGIPVLCFIDEVLRGTNTLERIAASSQILKQIAGYGALCFAATHDLEIAQILNKYYDNYHFEETVKEDDVKFDYKLRKGTTRTRNAIKLLGMTGYDKAVTSEAEKSAQYFIENGKWRDI